MKQILPKLKKLNKDLNFVKKVFTKNGFRNFTNYVDEIITLNKKIIKQISVASLDEKHNSQISYPFNEAKFEQENLDDTLPKH